MKQRKPTLLLPIVWFVVAGIWAVTLFTELYHQSAESGSVILHTLCICACLFCAIAHLVRYIKWKNQGED